MRASFPVQKHMVRFLTMKILHILSQMPNFTESGKTLQAIIEPGRQFLSSTLYFLVIFAQEKMKIILCPPS